MINEMHSVEYIIVYLRSIQDSIENMRATDQIKSNQIKSNQIKSNRFKSNQIKSNQIRANIGFTLSSKRDRVRIL